MIIHFLPMITLLILLFPKYARDMIHVTRIKKELSSTVNSSVSCIGSQHIAIILCFQLPHSAKILRNVKNTLNSNMMETGLS